MLKKRENLISEKEGGKGMPFEEEGARLSSRLTILPPADLILNVTQESMS